MTRSARPVSVCLAGAAFAGALGAFSVRPDAPLARLALIPDLLSFADGTLGAASNAGLAGLAGAVIGFSLAASAKAGGAPRPVLLSALLLANPIAVYAFAGGAGAALLLAAGTIVACAAVGLAATRDYRAAVLLSFALALAPFLSSTLLFLYPLLFLALPLASPWGLAAHKAAGFAVVVWSPFAMALAGLAYLHGLLGPPGGGAPFDIAAWRGAFGEEFLLLAAGAGLISLAAIAGSRLAGGLAFLAGAELLALTHPEWFRGL